MRPDLPYNYVLDQIPDDNIYKYISRIRKLFPIQPSKHHIGFNNQIQKESKSRHLPQPVIQSSGPC